MHCGLWGLVCSPIIMEWCGDEQYSAVPWTLSQTTPTDSTSIISYRSILPISPSTRLSPLPLLVTQLQILIVVCMRFQGASLAPIINDLFMIMVANYIQGCIEPTFSRQMPYNWGEPQSGKLTRPGIGSGPARWEATMLPLDHSGGLLQY